MILLIDNYDSFVHNLARYFGMLDQPRMVVRNDQISLAAIAKLQPSHIVISPGPCSPNEAGISLDVIKHFGATTPILGICLGHQAIGQAYGASIVRATKPMHGQSALITHQQQGIFANVENPLMVGRYHSLIVSQANFPAELICTALSAENEIMALQHQTHPVYGLQFHPESILTQHGSQLLENFIGVTKEALAVIPLKPPPSSTML